MQQNYNILQYDNVDSMTGRAFESQFTGRILNFLEILFTTFPEILVTDWIATMTTFQLTTILI